ncbi:MAG: DUF1835 domain-containing protein [Bacteroidota bacterium]|nr:DUF1835 domain-containing protein [Bacteroidota bacterium]
MLHVTNGDSAADLIHRSGIGGSVLPWRDVLHIGPVPGTLSVRELSEKRAAFLASLGWGVKEELMRSFLLRNSTLRKHAADDEVVLWFEHDLYDQLQLIQILALLVGTKHCSTERQFLICIDRYPGVRSFRGLGDLTPVQIRHLFDMRKPINLPQFHAAADAWACFTSSKAVRHQAVADNSNTELPFLQAAYRRFLQEWPSIHNGLSRTEEHALRLIANGVSNPVEVLHSHWANERAPFMGDWTFWEVILDMARGGYPLVAIEGDLGPEGFRDASVSATPEGLAVLRGDEDAITLRGIDRWYGGYHANRPEEVTRWDPKQGRLQVPGVDS